MANDQGQYFMPIGPGGIPGRAARMLVFAVTGGFLYPNVFVEGMDCTKIHEDQQGALYDDK